MSSQFCRVKFFSCSCNKMMTKLIFILSIFCIFSVRLSTSDADTDHRIIGGRPATDGEFPYQVSIKKSYNDQHFCGGSIIGKRIILTAAHCLFYRWGGVLPPIVISVLAGQNSLTITSQSIYRNASKVIVHENFDKDTFANDIAIIEVSEDFPIVTNKLISKISLQNETLETGTCTASGWGVQNVSDPIVSEQLYAVDVNVINMSNCSDMYDAMNITLSKGMMCAGVPKGDKDACQGDSGGPLACNGFLTGIVSTGKGCANPSFPGIYTDIAQFLPWIEKVIESSEMGKKDRPKEEALIDKDDDDITSFLGHLFNSANNVQRKSVHFIILLLMICLFF